MSPVSLRSRHNWQQGLEAPSTEDYCPEQAVPVVLRILMERGGCLRFSDPLECNHECLMDGPAWPREPLWHHDPCSNRQATSQRPAWALERWALVLEATCAASELVLFNLARAASACPGEDARNLFVRRPVALAQARVRGQAPFATWAPRTSALVGVAM